MGTSQDRLKFTLPPIMQIDFWERMEESIGEELESWHDQITQDRKINDFEEGFTNQLLALCTKYGYSPNLYLDVDSSTDDFLQQEIELIPTRIKFKSTFRGFDLLFQAISESGFVYNVYWDQIQFTRSMDTTTILAAMALANLYEPFLPVTPETDFTSFLDPLVTLDDDPLRTLDESPVWQLNEETTIGTSHLAVEHVIQEAYEYPVIAGEWYLLDQRYFDYYGKSTEYNRSVEMSAHPGAQLSMLMGTSGEFDTDMPLGESYSIPDLRCNCAITTNFQHTIMIRLDNYLKLDAGLEGGDAWFLDQDFGTVGAYTNDNFKYIVGGVGSKTLLSIDYLSVFNDMILRWEMDDVASATVFDSSGNANAGVVVGDWKRIDGIIGKTVDFDGVNYVTSSSTIAVTDTDFVISFWVNPNVLTTGVTCIFDFDIFNATYDHVAKEITFTSTIVGDTFSNQYACAEDTESFWQFELDWSTKEIYIYKNTVLTDTITITAGITIADSYILLVGDGASSDPFEGIIDCFTVTIKIWTVAEKAYLYANKVSVCYQLEKPIFRRILSDLNATSSATVILLRGIIESNRVEREVIHIGDGSINITGTSLLGNITSGTFYIDYSWGPANEMSIRDNYDNIILDERLSGTINYVTGAYDIDFYRDYEVSQRELTAFTTDTVTFALESYLQTSYVRVQYWVDDDTNAVVANDDGLGVMVCSGVTVGSVDYTIGEVTITLPAGTFLSTYTPFATFTYRKSATPVSGSEVLLSYNVDDDVDITEVGIEDSSHNLMVYGTFPQINFGSANKHVGIQFGIVQ